MGGGLQALADWVVDGGGAGGESVGGGSVVGCCDGHGVCGRGVVSDESACGYPGRWGDGDGEVWACEVGGVRFCGAVRLSVPCAVFRVVCLPDQKKKEP